MGQKGILAVVSGFSGAGKGALVHALLRRYPGKYALSVSATTRQPRAGEVDGRDYYFLPKEAFERLIEEDALIEYASYVHHYYGTPRKYVEEQLEAGKDVILEIELQGAMKVKESFPDSLLIFVAPPSAAELERRLRGRGTEDEETIRKRLHRAAEESEQMGLYDAILINDDLEACVHELHAQIRAQHGKTKENLPFIVRMQEELKRY